MRSWQICLSSSRVSWNESVNVQTHEKMNFVILSYFQIAFFSSILKQLLVFILWGNKSFECKSEHKVLQ